jgi:hypothetical protein
VKIYLLNANGAVSGPASGKARGLMGLNPAFGAHFLNTRIPGAVSHGKADIPALALSNWLRIEGATYEPDQSVAFQTRSNHAP